MSTKNERIANLEAIVRDIGERLDRYQPATVRNSRDIRATNNRHAAEVTARKLLERDINDRLANHYKRLDAVMARLTDMEKPAPDSIQALLREVAAEAVAERIEAVDRRLSDRADEHARRINALEKAHDGLERKVDTLEVIKTSHTEALGKMFGRLEALEATAKPVTVGFDHGVKPGESTIIVNIEGVLHSFPDPSVVQSVVLAKLEEVFRHLSADRDEWKGRCEHLEAAQEAHSVYDWRPGDIIAEPAECEGWRVHKVEHWLTPGGPMNWLTLTPVCVESDIAPQWFTAPERMRGVDAEACKPQR